MLATLNLLTKEAICQLLPISQRGLGDLVASNRFPRPERIGKRCMWTQEAVMKWREDLAAKQLRDPAFRR